MKTSRITDLERETNDLMPCGINFTVGQHESLLATAKKRTLAWFGHATRRYSLSKVIIRQSTEEDGRLRGQQEKMLDGRRQLSGRPCTCLGQLTMASPEITGEGSLLNRPGCPPSPPSPAPPPPPRLLPHHPPNDLIVVKGLR